MKVRLSGVIACCGLVLAFRAVSPAQQQTPSVAAGFQEHILGERDGLKIIVWVRTQASLGDDDWLQIEIINSGVAGTIKTLEVKAPVQSNGSFNSSNAFGSLAIGVTSGVDRLRYQSEGRTIPAGRYLTSEPGVHLGSSLGVDPGIYFRASLPEQRSNLDVRMSLAVALTLTDGRSFSTTAPAAITLQWQRPTDAQVSALRKRTVFLIEKTLQNSQLSVAEVEQLRVLLRNPMTGEDVSLELGLKAIRAGLNEGSSLHSGVAALVVRRWPGDPRVTAFYREALETQGPKVMIGLPLWDRSFIEPVIKHIESDGGPMPGAVMSQGLSLMDRNYATWSADPTIAPRLSKAVLRFPPERFVNGMYVWADLLALTHDRGAIAALLPYLSNKSIDQFTSVSSNMPYGVTPMRYSELAANTICRLLGEPIMFDPHQGRAPVPARRRPSFDHSVGGVVKAGGPYPQWVEWDKKIAALQERLKKLGYREPVSGPD